MNNGFRDTIEKVKGKQNPLENATAGRRAAYIVIAVLLCALGLFMAIRPEQVTDIIQLLLGAVLLAAGSIVAFTGYKSRNGSNDKADKMANLKLVCGAAAAVFAVIVFLSEGATSAIMGTVIGAVVLVKSFFALTAALKVIKFGGSRGGVLMTISISTAIIGVFLMVSMGGGAAVEKFRTGGIVLTVEGVLDFVYALLMPYSHKIKDVKSN